MTHRNYGEIDPVVFIMSIFIVVYAVASCFCISYLHRSVYLLNIRADHIERTNAPFAIEVEEP
jgi:hypothetical protein